MLLDKPGQPLTTWSDCLELIYQFGFLTRTGTGRDQMDCHRISQVVKHGPACPAAWGHPGRPWTTNRIY